MTLFHRNKRGQKEEAGHTNGQKQEGLLLSEAPTQLFEPLRSGLAAAPADSVAWDFVLLLFF